MPDHIVDVHAHAFFREFFEEINAETAITIPLRDGKVQNRFESWGDLTDVDARLAAMDRVGISRQLLSYSSIENFVDPRHWETEGLRLEIARTVNDTYAAVVDEHPERFGAFADVPLVGREGVVDAVAEVERAVTQLGFEGVTLNSNYHGVRPDDPALGPLLATIDDLNVPIFMHPSNPVGSEEAMEDLFKLSWCIGYPMETTISAFRLILSGTLDEYDLDVIAPHVGGTIPYLAYRLGLLFDDEIPASYTDDLDFEADPPYWPTQLDRPAEAYLTEHFYYDTALSGTHQFGYARDRFGDRLIYGSDVPWFPPAQLERLGGFIKDAGLSEDEREALYWRNAADIGLGAPR